VKEIKSIFQKNFSKNHTVIFGINLKNEYAKEESYFNSLIAVNNNFEIIYKYNKRKLVPFGEFLPFEDFFNNIGLQKISRGYGSFSKGTKQQNLIIYDYKILPLICYEIIFPEITQNKNNEVNFILNISEDGWFGGTIGPYQHFTKAIFRAIESNTYLLRSANKGISAFINNKGISIKRLEPYESGNIEFQIPLIQNNYKNKNDLIFFLLLFTYTIIFLTLKNRFK
jgi:apolipoprotein N-acyltransferase